MKTNRSLLAFITFLALALPIQAAEVTATRTDRGVTVEIDGHPFTEYLIQSNTKPILWPIIGPTGKPMTRAWPMDLHTKEKRDEHPHHRSFWFTHGNVNGIDFWAETPKGKTGRVVHRDFVKISSGPVAEVIARDDWLSPKGKKVCEDERRLAFGTLPPHNRGQRDGGAAAGTSRWIDFDVTLRASEGPLEFGDTKEGSFGLRVAESLAVDSKKGGQVVNSRGQTDAAAWGKRAEWVDYHGPIDGQTVGIAILNHPSSFRYPTGWHVRTYGLFAANPFAEAAFALKPGPQPSYTLPQGDEINLRYRILLHLGDEKQGRVAEAFAEYAKIKK